MRSQSGFLNALEGNRLPAVIDFCVSAQYGPVVAAAPLPRFTNVKY